MEQKNATSRRYTLTLHWKYFGARSYNFSTMHSAIEAAKRALANNEYIAYITLKSTPLTSL